MELLNGLLINLLFILILILLANMLLWTKYKIFRFPNQKWIIFFVAALSIVLCLLLSVPMGEGYRYDLRFIPFLLGAIYAGKRVTIGLAGFLLTTRYLLGGDGFWVSLVLTTIAAVLIIYIRPLFLKRSTKTKVMIVTSSSFVYSLFGYLVPSLFYPFSSIKNYLIYAFVLTISTFFVSYLLEILRATHVLQLEAIKYEKMEIVSHLAASISHEVRNPLTTVIGFLQLIHEHKKTDEDCKAYAKYAIEEANRASEIINDYLTFAKPHSEKRLLMNIENEVNKCAEILRPLTIKENIHVEKNFFHKGKINGDPHKFHQVLLNIFKNGIEAMPNGGKLSIITTEEKGLIHIRITDTGHGMKEEHIARLGEPYFSLKEQKGTGLGMMVVYKIVDSMKGSVCVSSKLNIGTSITLTFPSIK
ncbi:ATP-binding protein [Bacillus massilinigeriensis]|uniref:ATP-binding protein n=1 Tax=Bacillus massilionigeriensis TaxID=1805475 RepID=UPI000A3DC1B8|nr:sensor histidine kinase [Bacillus massilionigeriensis]